MWPRRRRACRGPSTAPRRGGSAVVVKRVARAVEDGYESELVPGLKASGDARRLAAEIAFSTARLAELAAAGVKVLTERVDSTDLNIKRLDLLLRVWEEVRLHTGGRLVIAGRGPE